MSFQDAVAEALSEHDRLAGVDKGDVVRCGQTLGGLSVYYTSSLTTADRLRGAGFVYDAWRCRSPVNGREIAVHGWRVP